MKAEVIDNTTQHFLQVRYGIIGNSQLITEVIQKLLSVAPTDLSVLITGETGTGKEVFAQAIHGLSNRKKYPFVSVNCGAIPETLLESELFGHEKGAFTGAVEQRKGFFEVANHGSIFLDEIGEMPISTQVKLLRVLESGQFSRLGSSDIHKVDVRIITATNRDLEYEVRKQQFRHDLFFRLNSVHLRLPALRKHPEDIPLLIEFFSDKVARKLGIEFKGVSFEAELLLKSFPWQGNIRELRNFIETVVTLERGALITPDLIKRHLRIQVDDFSSSIRQEESIIILPKPNDQHGQATTQDESLLLRTLLELHTDVTDIKRALAAIFDKITHIEVNQLQTNQMHNQSTQQVEHSTISDNMSQEQDFRLEEMERKLIIAALKRFDGNRRLAAKVLGISERTLYRKIVDYQLIELF